MHIPSWKKIVTTGVIAVAFMAGVFYLANRGNKIGVAVVTAGKRSAA